MEKYEASKKAIGEAFAFNIRPEISSVFISRGKSITVHCFISAIDSSLFW